MAKTLKDLNDEQKEAVLESCYHITPVEKVLRRADMTRREFAWWLRRNPEFRAEYDLARIEGCPFIESDLLNIMDTVENHKMAGVISSNIMKVLMARDPQKYGNKLDLSVNQTISIKSNLETANERIGNTIRDVTPLLASTHKI